MSKFRFFDFHSMVKTQITFILDEQQILQECEQDSDQKSAMYSSSIPFIKIPLLDQASKQEL